MKIAVFITTLTLALCLASCNSKPANSTGRGARGATPAPKVSPTPKPRPLIAYLNEGNLYVIQADGTGTRLMAATPEGDAIQDFVWAADGSRLYFSIGLQFFEVVLVTGNVASAGELTAPPGVTIDRLELARDGRTIIVQALDADAASRTFAVTIGQRESRELGIDEYNALIRPRPPVIRAVGEMAVSPDGRRILFKDLAGTGEELFIADAETGARTPITNLYELSGFEESVETEGGRRVIEAAWSPDGRFVIFNPMQSCSETGLCYGRLFLVEAWGGAQLQLSLEMMVNLPTEWTPDSRSLVYDDGSNVVLADSAGNPKALGEGNRPKWQPQP
jgi:Tol biopolymer transport system component